MSTSDEEPPMLTFPETSEAGSRRRRGQSNVPTGEKPNNDKQVTPTVREAVNLVNENLNRRVKITGTKKSLQSMMNPTLKDKYKVSNRFSNLVTKEKKVWDDKYALKMDSLAVTLWREANRPTRREYLKTALECMTKEVSTNSVGVILTCAWGLRSCDNVNDYVYPLETDMIGREFPLKSLDERQLVYVEDVETFEVTAVDSPDWNHFERSVCFICNAIIRLIVKEEDNLINAWTSITGQYRNFYQEEMNVEVEPEKKCLRMIRDILQNRLVMRGTIAAFLYACQSLEGQNRGMVKMLYELQLTYTGLHGYSLFMGCTAKLRVPFNVMLPLLGHPMANDALEMIMKLLDEYEYPEGSNAEYVEENAKLWRFARIFHADVFSSLQTKNCSFLVALLAFIANDIGFGGSGDVTKINQIQQLVSQQKKALTQIAKRAVQYCMAGAWADANEISGIYDIDEEEEEE